MRTFRVSTPQTTTLPETSRTLDEVVARVVPLRTLKSLSRNNRLLRISSPNAAYLKPVANYAKRQPKDSYPVTHLLVLSPLCR